MTTKKISIATLAFLLLTTIVYAQRSDIFYTQFTGKNGSFSINYDRKIGAIHNDAAVHCSLYGHVGIGRLSSQEVIATKFIPGNRSNPNTGSLGLDILIFIITFESDKTLERKQYFDVTNYSLGGSIVLGKGKFNGIVGLDVRFDRINQTIEAWEKIPEQTKNFNNTVLSPSVGLRWNEDYFMAQLLLAPRTIYGNQGSTDGVINVGVGFQF